MAKKPTKSRQMSVYSNLTHKRKVKKDTQSRKKAEYMASLPKHPFKRMLHRMHPRRLAGYWFSKKGLFMALKIAGIGALLVALMIGALFAYYRKDLDSIRPGELAKRVQTTVTRYLDRDGKPLWEDKGDGNYKLVVNAEDINEHMKQATIAIEDKDFYKHGGVSVSGITRSLVNNTKGGSTQGGSTLTQQLVKQVFFADEAQKRGFDGIPRKIKEMILSIEVERMYDKNQILTLYLNESPYGGRRNGVQSGAQTYFGKNTKELSLPEAALLAAIPNNPTIYDPYNVPGHESLISRQHKVLDSMVSESFITQSQADTAKKYPILDNIQPAAEQYAGIKAPHFVQMVRSQLEQELGKATVGRGGLTVKTTLDLEIQNKLEADMAKMFSGGFGYDTSPSFIGYSNGAATVEDTKTGQIVALMGSRDFSYPGYGQDNAALAFVQPGSSIKPLVYAQLIQNQGPGKPNYGSGSILADDNSIDDIYGAPLKNADGKFKGSINIRKSLTMSRNIPAIKAMYISGKDQTWKTIRDLGNTFYCTQGGDAQAGLASAIGGCGTRQVDHTNAMASLGRMGVYKPWSGVLEVTNSSGEVLKTFKDENTQVVDPETAYIINDMLGDVQARKNARLYGGGDGSGTTVSNSIGLKVALKTGTSDKNGKPKDIWTIGYTPNLSMSVWLGNPDTSILNLGYSYVPAKMVDSVLAHASQQYQNQGKGKISDWFTRPKGVQTINGELFPSWYNKNQGQSNAKLTFDRVSKKKATKCTPEGARIEIDVLKFNDPITKGVGYIAPDGYDATKDDDVHKCEDAKPTVGTINVDRITGVITVAITSPNPITDVDLQVDGVRVDAVKNGDTYTATFAGKGKKTISVTATDKLYYTGTRSSEGTFGPPVLTTSDSRN